MDLFITILSCVPFRSIAFKTPSWFHVQVLKETVMLTYIDKVYANPDAERARALGYAYPKVTSMGSSPGRTVSVPVDRTSDAYKKIMDVFRARGQSVRVANHVYRLARADDLPNGYLHADESHYHAIISLTPQHASFNDALDVYVHRDQDPNKGFDFVRMQYDRAYQAYADRCLDDAFHHRHVTLRDTCPYVYNRCVLVDATWLHSPRHGYFGGNDAGELKHENARLVEIFSLQVVSHLVKSPHLRYIGFYPNILNDHLCEELLHRVHEACHPDVSQYREHALPELLQRHDHMLLNMSLTYARYMIQWTPEWTHWFELAASRSGSGSGSGSQWQDAANWNVQVHAIVYPQHDVSNWDAPRHLESSGGGHLTMLLSLNDHPTGYTIYDPFLDEPCLIPAKRNSLIVYPCTWLYPLKQTYVTTNDAIDACPDKYLLRFTLTYTPISSRSPADLRDSR